MATTRNGDPQGKQATLSPVMERLRALPIAAPANRLRVGDFQLAFGDGVLLVESGTLTVLHTDLAAGELRIVATARRVMLDLLRRPACTLSLVATSDERDAAIAYFRERNVGIESA